MDGNAIGRRAFGLAVGCTALARRTVAQDAATYPDRPPRIIVPFAAGATNDLVARLLANALAAPLGQSVVVENRPGGGGFPGTLAVVRARPDGLTLLLGNTSLLAINVSLRRDLPYDPLTDFAAVSQVATSPSVLAVPASLGIGTPAQLIALLRARGAELSYASGGIGTPMHLSGELFKQQTGTAMAHLPYPGSAPAVTDLLAGRVALMFDNIPSVLPHIRAGTLRAIVVTGPRRLALLPEVPTIAEAGFAGAESYSFFVVVAPKGTPRPIVERLSDAVRVAVQQPSFRERLIELGAEPAWSTPDETRAFLQREITVWARAVQASGAQVD